MDEQTKMAIDLGQTIYNNTIEQLEAENASLKEQLSSYENRSRVGMGLEIEKLHEQLDRQIVANAALTGENAELFCKLTAAQKDAERYRWLRERMDLKDVSIIRLRNDPNEEYDSEVDAAIDTAMKEGK